MIILRVATWLLIAIATGVGAWLVAQPRYEFTKIFDTNATVPEKVTGIQLISPMMIDSETVAFQADQDQSHPVFRSVRGKVERLAAPVPAEYSYAGPQGSYAFIGDKCYYAVGLTRREVMSFENGKETPVLGQVAGVRPGDHDCACNDFASDGETLAFDTGNFGIYTYRSGSSKLAIE